MAGQRQENVFYLGPGQTFCYQAARKLRPEATWIECPSIPAVFESLAEHPNEFGAGKRIIYYGVVPFKNSRDGGVDNTLDALLRGHLDHGINATDSTVININMAIGGRLPPDQLDKVKLVVSKKEALSQCHRYLADNFAHAQQREVESTGYAATLVAEDKAYRNAAALGPKEALEGLHIYAEGITDQGEQKTDFLQIERSRYAQPIRGRNRTTIAIYQEHSSTDLSLPLLQFFRKQGVQVLDNFDRRTGVGRNKVYYFNLAGHVKNNDRLQVSLAELEHRFGTDIEDIQTIAKLYVLGSYGYQSMDPDTIKRVAVIGAPRYREDLLRRVLTAKGYVVNNEAKHMRKRRKASEAAENLEQKARGADAVVVHTYGGNEEALVKRLAPFIYTGKLLVVNSRSLGGKEAMYKQWIYEEICEQAYAAIRKYRFPKGAHAHAGIHAGLEKHVLAHVDVLTKAPRELSRRLAAQRCEGIEFLGMKLQVTHSTKTLKDRQVIFTADNNPQSGTRTYEFMEAFHDQEAQVVLSTPSRHDDITQLIRGTCHGMAQVFEGYLRPDDNTSLPKPPDSLRTVFAYGTPSEILFLAAAANFRATDAHQSAEAIAAMTLRDQLLERYVQISKRITKASANFSTANLQRELAAVAEWVQPDLKRIREILKNPQF